MTVHRYFYYLIFAAGALVFWPLYLIFVLEAPLGDPACSLEPSGCPPPTLWRQMLNIVSVLGAIPLTVLLFVLYRRLVRRLLDCEEFDGDGVN